MGKYFGVCPKDQFQWKKKCIICGKEFSVSCFSLLKNFSCCSKECRKKRISQTSKERTKGIKHWNFKDGKVTTDNGYILLCINALPENDKMLAEKMRPHRSQIHEHRLVMAKHLGRPLEDFEIVHHLNGNRTDNRIENLQLMTKEKHPCGHEIICPHCGQKILF